MVSRESIESEVEFFCFFLQSLQKFFFFTLSGFNITGDSQEAQERRIRTSSGSEEMVTGFLQNLQATRFPAWLSLAQNDFEQEGQSALITGEGSGVAFAEVIKISFKGRGV